MIKFFQSIGKRIKSTFNTIKSFFSRNKVYFKAFAVGFATGFLLYWWTFLALIGTYFVISLAYTYATAIIAPFAWIGGVIIGAFMFPTWAYLCYRGYKAIFTWYGKAYNELETHELELWYGSAREVLDVKREPVVIPVRQTSLVLAGA